MTRSSFAAGLVALGAFTVAGAAGCGNDSSGSDCSKKSGVICTVAGTGLAGNGADGLAAAETKLYLPIDTVTGPDGLLYVIDWNNHRIRVIGADGKMHIVAGKGELGPNPDDPQSSRLNHPTDIIFDGQGCLVIAAWHNSKIKKTCPPFADEPIDICGDGSRGMFTGDGGPAKMAKLDLPASVAFDAAGNLIFTDQGNKRIRKVDTSDIINTIAGTGMCPMGSPQCFCGDGGPASMACFGFQGGQAAEPQAHLAIDADGSILLADSNNHRIRRIDPAGVITTIVGTGEKGSAGDGGPAAMAQLNTPTDIAIGAGGVLFIADKGNHCIRKVQDGSISTVAGVCGTKGYAGDNGPATAAQLSIPYGISVDPAGNLAIADSGNHRVRIVYK